MNIVILSGRLTADPDIRMGTNDTKIARYILAVERRVKKNTERKSDFIACVCLGKNAEFAEKYLKKGTKVNVRGEWQTGNYTNKNGEKVTEAAVIYEPASGIQMRVITDQPAMQFYGGNFFEGKDTGKYGEVYNFRTSFAMETQHFPDSPNQKSFPTTTLNPGETYSHLCIYKFEIK